MKEKKLPVGSPFIYGYKHHAIPLSLFALDEDSLSWICSNFIQLVVTDDFLVDPHWLDFYMMNPIYSRFETPGYLASRVDRKIVSLMTNPIDLVTKCIKSDIYILANGDQFYLPHSNSHRKMHRISSFLIHGFNEREQSLNIYDYSYSTKRIFESLNLSYTDFEQSFISQEIKGSRSLWLLERRTNTEYTFSLQLVIQLLEDYLGGKNHLNAFTAKEHKAFGINTYSYLYQYLELLIDDKTWSNILPLHTLWEHKKCLHALINYLISTKHLLHSDSLQTISEIEQEACICRNVFLKFSVNGKKNELENIINKINRIEAIEHSVLSSVLSQLKK